MQAEQKELKRDMQATAVAAASGSKAAVQAYVGQSKALAGLRNEYQQYGNALSQAVHGTQNLSNKSNKFGMVLGQLSFAVDDFTQVIGTAGLAGGIRAAGNNLSMVAMQLHPLAGMFVGVGLAALAFSLQTDKSVKSTDKLKESMERAKDAAERYKEVLVALETGIEKATKTPAQIAMDAEDKQIAKSRADLGGQLTQTDVAIRAKRKSIDAIGNEKDPLNTSPNQRVVNAANRQARIKSIEEEIGPLLFKKAEIEDQLQNMTEQKSRLDMARMTDTVKGSIVPGFRKAVRMGREIFGGASNNTDKAIQGEGVEFQQGIVKRDQMAVEDATLAARDASSAGGRKITKNEQAQIDALVRTAVASERQLEVLQAIRDQREKDMEEDNLAKRAVRGAALDREGQGK